MRIAYICADVGVPVFGTKGCSIHVQEVVRAMLRIGVRVTLYASRLGGSPPPDLARVPVLRLPEPSNMDSAEREQFCLAANDRLIELLDEDKPYDLIYERYSLWSYAAMAFADGSGIPGVLEVNAPLLTEQAEHRVLHDLGSAQQVAERAFKSATRLVAVSSEVRAYLQRFPETTPKISLVPNGVDTDRFHPKITPVHRESNVFTIGFLGGMRPWHGLCELLAAFHLLHREYPQTRLLLIGDGPERSRIADLSGRLSLGTSVTMAGRVSPEEVPSWLTSMDAAVAPYPPSDSFYFSPLKVYEYMASGLPTVASRIGQLDGLVEDNVNGLLYQPGNREGLKEKIETLIQDPALRVRLGRAARRTVRRNHTWTSRVGDIFDEVGLGTAVRERKAEVVA